MPDLQHVADRVAKRLLQRGETVAVAESSAGGLVASALLAVPGASANFRGGAVVYTAKARAALLGLGRADVAGLRSASEPYAALLARTSRERLDATWGLAETGRRGRPATPMGTRPAIPASP